MYFLAILGVILLVVLGGGVTQTGFTSLLACLDSMSMLLIVVIVIPVMASMGMLKDLNHAFRLTFGRRKAESLRELKRAKLAITYLIKCLIFAGVVGALLGVIQVLSLYNGEIRILAASLGVAVCPLLYAFVIAIILIPLEAGLEQKILEFMESGE